MKKIFLVVSLIVAFWPLKSYEQERPFIWVKSEERDAILQKIEQQSWAKSLYKSFEARLDKDFTEYEKNPEAFLSKLPYDWNNQKEGFTPPLLTIKRGEPGSGDEIDEIMKHLQLGIDCGMFYYFTSDEKYAQCAVDILNAIIQGIAQIPLPKEAGNYGWILPEDHLYGARVFGAQIPIIYDFIAPYLKNGGQPFDIGKKKKIDFPVDLAQKVFYNYAKLAIEQGMTGSNWSVLEAPSFVHNLLALNHKFQRDSLLNIYLYKQCKRQDPFVEIASHYIQIGDVYPETSQYSSGVTSLTITLMAIVTRYKPELHLGRRYSLIPLALSRWESLKYPNDEIVRFGDGHRKGGTNYRNCEIAYYLSQLDSVSELTNTFGILINTAISKGEYQRGELGKRNFGASAYYEPLQLLWGCPEIKGDVETQVIPRTDNMPHASVYLQRNLSKTDKAEYGLMCFVGGAHMVHGHAEGMNIELYGRGQVLGVDQGRGPYRTDLHENYSRLFAAHNTVIVNGSSQGDSGWVNLGINPVKLITMEPMPREEAISPDYSFSITSFDDDRGDKAEAYQERTLALIRTSETTGFYVDVFRSKSKLPNEYHDYLYHNIGDKLEFLNSDLELKPTPQRYMANANLPWIKNRQYRNPGWHFFEDVQTSPPYVSDVKLRFYLEKFEKPIYMDLYIPGFDNREYTKVMAPKTFEAPGPYEKKPTPTLVIRKNGEAWQNPFVVVFEPFDRNIGNHSIVSVEKLTQDGIYKGVKVSSEIEGKKIVQYVITQLKNQKYENTNLGISFQGTFAVLTCNEEDDIQNMYMGNGESLSYKKISIQSEKQDGNAYLDLTSGKPVFKSAFSTGVSYKISN